MIRLMGVELTRLRWRRAILVMLALAVAVPVVVLGVTAWNTRPYSDAEKAQIQQRVEEETNSRPTQRSLRDCLENPGNFGVPAGEDVQATCEEWILPQADWYGYRAQLDLVNERESGSGPVVIALLAVLLLLVGTTFAGHDWNTGSMSNQLLFDSRRVPVWLAKAAVVTLAGLVLAGAVLAAYWAGLWLLAEYRGLDPSGASISGGFRQALRGTLLAALAGLGGYALTMLFRSTVATLGVLLGISILAPILMAVVAFPNSERWMPHTNIAAVILDGTTYYDNSSSGFCSNDGCSNEHRLTLAGGSAYLLGLLAIAVAPSVATFRARDVP